MTASRRRVVAATSAPATPDPAVSRAIPVVAEVSRAADRPAPDRGDALAAALVGPLLLVEHNAVPVATAASVADLPRPASPGAGGRAARQLGARCAGGGFEAWLAAQSPAPPAAAGDVTRATERAAARSRRPGGSGKNTVIVDFSRQIGVLSSKPARALLATPSGVAPRARGPYA